MKAFKHNILAIVGIYTCWFLFFVVQKPLFMLWYRGMFDKATVTDWLQVVLHGLPLDFSLAGYLTVIPAIMLIAGLWTSGKLLRYAEKCYYATASSLVSAVFLLNLVLYDYWSFPLDATPLFYFMSSPKDAFASATPDMIIGAFVSLILISGAIYFCMTKCHTTAHVKAKTNVTQRWVFSVCMLLLTALLFIPIRGGFSVASMNTGRVYYSERQELNHAAVNPLFSLMESLTHQTDFKSQYRFMEAGKAEELMKELTDTKSQNTEVLLNNRRPNIYIIILESFSSHLMETLGGKKGIAVNLDKLAQEGVLFTNFYANSFRTDRGIVSILSGFPAQPTMSIMKFPHKTASLPSLAEALKENGYTTKYYYGGDVNFTNMRSYLINQGYENIVSDVDFALKDRQSKWGVHDHLLFERISSDLKKEQPSADKTPKLCVVQTSSSHEPYDVPYSKFSNERLNAFAYTDDCVGKFISQLRGMKSWQNTLVVLVPDHQGCWPKDMNPQKPSRYKIPLILVGGVIKEHRTVDTYGSQQDLAATLLGQLGIEHSNFIYSKDLMDNSVRHFAFFSFPDLFGMIDKEGEIIFDNKQNRVVHCKGNNTDSLQLWGKALLQTLYDDIDHR